MIKVLGIDPKVARKITCRNCGSILEYFPRDIKTKNVTDYTGDTEYVDYISCPECKEHVHTFGH